MDFEGVGYCQAMELCYKAAGNVNIYEHDTNFFVPFHRNPFDHYGKSVVENTFNCFGVRGSVVSSQNKNI